MNTFLNLFSMPQKAGRSYKLTEENSKGDQFSQVAAEGFSGHRSFSANTDKVRAKAMILVTLKTGIRRVVLSMLNL